MTVEKWTGTTFGNGWMHRALINMLKYVDVRFFYVFVSIFIVPFCLIFDHHSGYIYKYFRRRLGYSRIRSCRNTITNYCLFSQAVIDKFAMYAGKKFDVRVEGYEYFKKLAEQNMGFVQLSSHIGNYEIAGYTLVSDVKPINALVFGGEKASVMMNREKIFSKTNIRIIPIMSDMSHIFAINSALDNNEIVSVPGDRRMGSPKTIRMDFLGASAEFPIGPFAIAAMHGVAVIAVNVMKTGVKQYTIYVRPLEYDRQAPRLDQIRRLAEGYVKNLTLDLKRYPAQWYNYFDFWDNARA